MNQELRHGVHLRNMIRTFGKVTALDSVNFSFHPGQVHGFIGPNGAGKTTAMRILATIDVPDAGDAFIMGHSIIREPHLVRRHIGFVPDWFAGFRATTVHEYLDFFARACSLKGAERIGTVGDIEEFTGLTPLRDKLLSELSRGMQQRVTLGRALINNPSVLLMDEPAANLDPRSRIELRELVKVLAERGKCILISSHILPELAEMCDSVTIIDKGRILATGEIEAIKKTLRPHRRMVIRALCENDTLERALLETPGVENVALLNNEFKFDFRGENEQVASILKHLVSGGVPVMEFKLIEEGLEDIFMNITGKADRESSK